MSHSDGVKSVGPCSLETAKRVLFVHGAGSGLGKSTLARALLHWIEAKGLSARLFSEESASDEPAFRPYVAQVHRGNAADVSTLLECCAQFVADIGDTAVDVVVLDSLLPCWDWLYSAGVSEEIIFDFTDNLTSLLNNLCPVLVLVEGDLDQALDRAIEDRDIEWALALAERRTGHRDRDSLLSYFQGLRSGTGRVLSRWNFPVVAVDTVAEDLETAVRRTSEYLRAWWPV